LREPPIADEKINSEHPEKNALLNPEKNVLLAPQR
jgi:hypothetical protein